MIAISVTPYSRETIEACKFALARGVWLVMVSDSDVISSEFSAHETLVASVITTHHFGCFSGVMAVLETLLALLVDQGGAGARARIKSYEDLRKDNNAYCIAQKKNISFWVTAEITLASLGCTKDGVCNAPCQKTDGRNRK
jgi:hypothetical protein